MEDEPHMLVHTHPRMVIHMKRSMIAETLRQGQAVLW